MKLKIKNSKPKLKKKITKNTGVKMAKFKTIKAFFDGSKYRELQFSYEVHTNSDGMFYTTLPENIIQPLIDHNIKIAHNPRTHKPGYFINETLSGLINEIDSLFEDFMSKEIVEDKIVIRYNINTKCIYVKDGEEIFPNGYYVKDHQFISGTNSLHAASKEPYGIEIYVDVRKKITYKFKTGTTKTVYDRVDVPNFSTGNDDNFYLIWINNIIGISDHKMTGSFKEIDYDEQRAKFFVDLIKSICFINENIIDNLEPDSIIKIIETKQKLIK
jgi:hypothetical protein